MALPAPGGFAVYPGDVDVREAAMSYGEYYHTTDIWTGSRRKALGLEVYSYDMLITRSEQSRSEFWNDWILPYRMCKPAGLSRTLEGSSVPASLMSYKEQPTASPFGDRELEILRMLQPSFETAVKALGGLYKTGKDCSRTSTGCEYQRSWSDTAVSFTRTTLSRAHWERTRAKS